MDRKKLRQLADAVFSQVIAPAIFAPACARSGMHAVLLATGRCRMCERRIA